MNKFILFIIVLIFPLLFQNVSAQSPDPNLQLRPLQIITPPPSIRPSTPGSTLPPSSTPPTQPVPTQPPTTPPRSGTICPYLVAVYGSENNVVSQEFGTIYPLPEAALALRTSLLQELKDKPNFTSLQDKGKLKIALSQVVAQTNGKGSVYELAANPNQYTVNSLTGRITVSSAKTKINPDALDPIDNSDDVIVEFYKTIYQVFLYANTQDNFFDDFNKTQRVLVANNIPAPPFVVLGSEQGGFGAINQMGFWRAGTLREATQSLGCEPNHPKRTVSASPLIHFYPLTEQKISIRLTPSLSFSSPTYSFTRGINLIAEPTGQLFDLSQDKLQQNFIYYEFLKPDLSHLDKGILIKGKDLKEVLISELLPRFKFTDYELQQFLEKDISPQISKTDPESIYKIMVLQNKEVEPILPLQISPKPDSLYRNLIVIRKTQDTDKSSVIKISPIKRSGFTAIENGFILLDN